MAEETTPEDGGGGELRRVPRSPAVTLWRSVRRLWGVLTGRRRSITVAHSRNLQKFGLTSIDDDEREASPTAFERLREQGFTDAEISQILSARDLGRRDPP